MERVPVDDLDPRLPGPGVERRGLSGPLGTTRVAVNHYRVAPGEELPGGLHAHADQEELFYVLEGKATFETYEPGGGPEAASGSAASSEPRGGPGRTGGEITVAAGEAIRFAPGEFQSGRNDAESDLVVLAVGAPRDSEDVRLPVGCPECGHDGMCMDAGDGVELACPDCGAERLAAPCPECGHEDLRVTLDDRATGSGEGGRGTGTVVACSGCGASFDGPPFRA